MASLMRQKKWIGNNSAIDCDWGVLYHSQTSAVKLKPLAKTFAHENREGEAL
jgi:hypothetical protein